DGVEVVVGDVVPGLAGTAGRALDVRRDGGVEHDELRSAGDAADVERHRAQVGAVDGVDRAVGTLRVRAPRRVPVDERRLRLPGDVAVRAELAAAAAGGDAGALDGVDVVVEGIARRDVAERRPRHGY